MSYTRLSKKTSLSWAAGASGSATAESAYRVSDLNFDNVRFDMIGNVNYVGAYQSDHAIQVGVEAISASRLSLGVAT